jgi:hypothetical protein
MLPTLRVAQPISNHNRCLLNEGVYESLLSGMKKHTFSLMLRGCHFGSATVRFGPANTGLISYCDSLGWDGRKSVKLVIR